MKHFFKTLALTLFVLCIGASSCATKQIESLCLYDNKDKVCYIDKETNKFYTLEQINNFFAMQDKDLKKLLKRLNQCENGNPQSVGKLETLCIVDSKDQMCWKNKPTNDGYTYQQIDLFFAMNEEDLKLILKQLNECQNPQN